jgi:hypothetical protein
MPPIRLHRSRAVHKDSLTIGNALSHPPREVRLLDTSTHDLHALERARDHRVALSTSVETTQIYMHVMRRPGLGVRSPLEREKAL